MKTTIRNIKLMINEAIENKIVPGDLVDVDTGEGACYKIRVLKLISDVRKEAGLSKDETWPGSEDFTGPGFVGVGTGDEGDWGKDEQGVFSLKQVIPGSKLKYFFPSEELL